jgi:hypothetical protein
MKVQNSSTALVKAPPIGGAFFCESDMRAITLISLLCCLGNANAGTAAEAWKSLLLPMHIERPEFAFVHHDPALPNVFIYGDSISIHYTQQVRQRLEGKANIYRIHRNGGDSGSFIPKMNEMHETMRDETLENYWDFGWDVIHFNVGLHDLKFVKDGKLDKQHGKQVSSKSEYENNLRQIIEYLQQLSPAAALIFATTTPVPEGAPGHVVDDAVKYNRVALKVLQDHPEVAINDLYELSLPNEKSWRAGPGNVHFAPEGRALQGDGVARAILVSLGSPDGLEIFVSPEGDDAAAGTRSDPVRTIDRALENVAPGDTVSLLGGRYSQPMTAVDVHGQNGRPVTIRSLPGGQVTFDGTDVLPGEWQEVTSDSPNGAVIQEAQWQRIGDNRVFSLKLDEPIHALIYDGKLMTEARWPNARWDDPWRLDRYNVLRRATEQSTPGELFDGFPTGNTLEESSKWVHYDRDARARYREMLAGTGIDFTGSVVVISYAWGSFATRVTEHQAGSNSFRFDTEFTGSGSIQEEAVRFVINRIQWDNPNRFIRSSHGGIHFFFEGLPALDIPEEWWYDENSKTLFFIAPNGKKPDPSKARGKRRARLPAHGT